MTPTRNNHRHARGWLPLGLLALVFILAGCASTGTSSGADDVLEYEHVFQYAQELNETDGQEVLTISGLCGHSAYVVEGIEVVRDGDRLQVLIYLRDFAKEWLSGSFTKSITIPNDVNEVTFGQDNFVIWSRDKGD